MSGSMRDQFEGAALEHDPPRLRREHRRGRCLVEEVAVDVAEALQVVSLYSRARSGFRVEHHEQLVEEGVGVLAARRRQRGDRIGELLTSNTPVSSAKKQKSSREKNTSAGEQQPLR